MVFNCIKNDIRKLAHDAKGNYVLIKIIEIMRGEKFDFITEHILPDTLLLVLDEKGVCIINKILELTNNEHHVRIIAKVFNENLTDIIQH